MVSRALQAIRRVVTVEWPKKAEAGARAHLLRTARAGHLRIMADAAAQGQVPTWEAYANTPGNKNLESVKLPGPIVYRYRYFSDIVRVALDALERASPVISGDYVRSHTVYINGAATETLPNRLRLGDTVMIANPVPYARKIEIGKTKAGRAFVIQVPNRIYERVAKTVLVPLYRNVAKVTFTYVTLPGAGTVARKGRRKRETLRSPAIIIEART